MIRKTLLLFSLVLTVALFSCSSDGDSNNQNTSNSIAASVGGQPWASMTGGAVANLSQIDVMGESRTVLQIMGAKTDMSSLSLQFPIDHLTAGTYTFNNDEAATLIYSAPGGTTVYSSFHETGRFSITISEVNVSRGTISGTFSGTLLDAEGNSMAITNGSIDRVSIMSTDLYSNGSMSLSRNGGTAFTMDNNQTDAKYLMIHQNSTTGIISLMGYNSSLTADAGAYNLNLPKNAPAGTYSLTANEAFSAGIGNSENQAEFNVTSGSVTITSHIGNNMVGTFSFTANNGTQTVTISNGSFNITHK